MRSYKNELFVAIGLTLVLLAACNGNGTSSSPLAGVYSGGTGVSGECGPGFPALPPGEILPINRLFGAIDDSGTGYSLLYHESGSSVGVNSSLSTIGSVDSMETDVPIEGQTPVTPVEWTLAISPSSSPPYGYSIQGQFQLTGLPNCLVHLSLATSADSHGGKDLLKTLSGSYAGFDVNRQTTLVATLDASGVFAGTDAMGCKIAGTLTQVGKLNVFDVELDISGPSACHGAMTGVAFRDTVDETGVFLGAAGSYLYLIGANGDLSHGFGMALKLQ